MKLAGIGELPLVEKLRDRFSRKKTGVLLGIGDDAAVIRPSGLPLLITTDMMVEGVHFDFSYATPYQVGYKLVSVNVSDVYAMGGTPQYLLLDFGAPGTMELKSFTRLFDGVEAAMKLYGVSLVGGDVSSAGELVLSGAVIGYGKKALRRAGARAGDRIYVTGNLGDSACGLALLKRMKKPVEIEKGKKALLPPLSWKVIRPLITRHLMPTAVRPGRFADTASAMMDISDGLLIDLSRLCRESGVGALLYEEGIPVSDALREASAQLRKDPLDFAFAGGEDYELLFTSPRSSVAGAFCVGEITGQGMIMQDRRGRLRKISAKGYRHFGVQD